MIITVADIFPLVTQICPAALVVLISDFGYFVPYDKTFSTILLLSKSVIAPQIPLVG